MVYMLSKPETFEGETLFSLCLPKIADDGFLQFYSKFFPAANGTRIGIVFAAVSKEDREDFGERASAMQRHMEQSHLAAEIARVARRRYTVSPCVNSSSLCLKNLENKMGVKLVVIKDEKYEQMVVNNLPAFAKLKVHKEQLQMLSETLQKMEGTHATSQYVQISEEDSIAAIKDKTRTVIVIGKGTLKSKILGTVCHDINKKVKKNEGRYFITNYV